MRVRQERRYKPTEVAAATGVDKRTVSREIVRGHLRAIRVGTRYWAVPESAIAEWLLVYAPKMAKPASG